ncbi:MAG: Stk1 family PASTA domain-containing Ser/Thr kinase [Acidimicrobiales bacterium]
MEPVDEPRLYSGRYQVTHLIARGGMAIVYRAQDTLLNRPVAIKTLYPELSADPQFVEGFRREAQAAANLSHPNIVPVFDWGEDNGTYFIVMELIDGTSLADMLRGGRTLTASHSATLMAQVAAALGYAHRNGVVHRDVKPGNILIASDGQVKVTDFGIAQAMSVEDQLADEGSVMGTATYFSPEQAEGAPVDGRSDIYSLGVVLYEMLAGRPPFIGDSPVAVSTQHVHGTVAPPTEFNSTIPSDLQAIVMEALAKSPDQRYQSAEDLRSDLMRFSEGQPVRAAQRDVAFFGADATRSVSRVQSGERTQAVPIMTGPRTDIKRRRNNNSNTGIIAMIIILLLAAGGLAYFFSQKSPTTTSMPNLVGLSETTAEATLVSKGIGVKKVIPIHSSTVKVDNVISTDPTAKTVLKKGQRVTLTVSLGAQAAVITIPKVVGLSVTGAESTLGSANYLLKVNPQFVTTAPPGVTSLNTVFKQSPLPGVKGHQGDTVTIYMLSPSAQFSVPSLLNDTTNQASATLGQANLIVGTTTSACSNSVPIGEVTGSSPAAGAFVNSGDQINLITSSGYCKVHVQSYTGESQSQATNQIKSAGLQVNVAPADPSTCSPTQVGTVQQQSATIGSYVLYKSTITLTICEASTEQSTTTVADTTTIP